MSWISALVPVDTEVRMLVASILELCSARLLSASTYTLMCAVGSSTMNFRYSRNRYYVLGPTLTSVMYQVPDPNSDLLLLSVRPVVISRTFPVVWSNSFRDSAAVAYL